MIIIQKKRQLNVNTRISIFKKLQLLRDNYRFQDFKPKFIKKIDAMLELAEYQQDTQWIEELKSAKELALQETNLRDLSTLTHQ